MEIKILCSCGSKYKFDLEPVGGRAPVDLACPACKASWTEQADAIIRQAEAATPRAAVATPAATHAEGRIKLQIGSPNKTAEPVPEVASPMADSQGSGVAAESPRAGHRKSETVSYETGPEPADWGKFALGSVGALMGALVGGFLYYLIYNLGFESKLMALGVAGIAGAGARLLGRKGSNELGLLTGCFGVGGILLALYLVAGNVSAALHAKSINEQFDAMVTDAKNVLRQIPKGTEQEVRAYLALQKFRDENGDRVTPESIPAAEVGTFRDETLPMFRRLADGTMTREEWKRSRGIKDGAINDTGNADEIEFTTKGVFVILAFSKFNLVCMIAAAGLGYKMTDG
jgi:hypothetical protein